MDGDKAPNLSKQAKLGAKLESKLEASEELLTELLQDDALFRSEELRPLRGLVTQLAARLWKGKAQKAKESKVLKDSDQGDDVGDGMDASGLSKEPPSNVRKYGEVCEVKPAQLSRLLYTNPVCILSSCDAELHRNLMTISWLTPIDNHGRMICSINKRRHSAAGVLAHKTFVLNVPSAELAQTVLEVGGCSGAEVDKLERFSSALGGCCYPGWKPLIWPPEDLECQPPVFALAGCVAHLVIQVQADLTSSSAQDAHHILSCTTLRAYVRSSYWDGKIFCPRESAAPYLTFFGSQTFGLVVPK